MRVQAGQRHDNGRAACLCASLSSGLYIEQLNILELQAAHKGMPAAASQRSSSRASWQALQLAIYLFALRGVQTASSSTSTRGPPVTFSACPSAFQAAQLLVGINSSLEISNAVWVGRNCSQSIPNSILVTNFSCHSLATSMPLGALVLSTGNASLAANLSNTGNANYYYNNAAQDADLVAISQKVYSRAALSDIISLTFDITAYGSGTVHFQYVFGSDEYPEYAPGGVTGKTYNDIFAFFIWPAPFTGTPTNIVLLPNSSTPVSIASVNPIGNINLYVSNWNGYNGTANVMGMPGSLANAMDGYTVLMNTSTYSFVAGNTYRLKLAIADNYDASIDSNVWIKAGSLQFAAPPIANCSGYWTSWTICSTANTGVSPADGGTTSRTYKWKWPALGGGLDCTIADNTVDTMPCPINCVGRWTAWTTCSTSCGNNTRTSTFIITTQAVNGGTNCRFVKGTVRAASCPKTWLCMVESFYGNG